MSYSEQLLDAIQAHQFDRNLTLLKLALANDTPEILASLADNLVDLGFTDLAKAVYRALIAQYPDEDLFKVYLAEILLNDGADDDALSLLYGVSKASDAYLDSLLIQADYYQNNGLIEPARAKLLVAHKMAPDEDAIKFGMAELDFMSGDYDEALGLYEELVKRQASFGEVNLHERHFETLAKLGRYEEAAQVIAAHETDLIDIDSQYQAGLVELAAGKTALALKYLNQVLVQSPDYVAAYPLLAQAYQRQHDSEQVLRTAQAGLAYNELDELLYHLGAQAASQLGETDTAVQLLTRGLKVNPDNSQLLLQLSNLYIQTHQYQANLDLLKPLADDQIEPRLRFNLAQSYEALDDRNQAKTAYLLAYQRLQGDAGFLKRMILFFRTLADTRSLVQELLRKYLKLVPTDEAMLALQAED
ncbi:MAG: tetratricopeptide repeat protein [Lactobacillus sp.]|nr:tetratricopeptide repeat protein [Lactobacillus sp.]MDN6052319.1 tetratricopeptide repeat protein [Lactobacillus sp.]